MVVFGDLGRQVESVTTLLISKFNIKGSKPDKPRHRKILTVEGTNNPHADAHIQERDHWMIHHIHMPNASTACQDDNQTSQNTPHGDENATEPDPHKTDANLNFTMIS